MAAASLVFALEIFPWDSEAEEDRGKEVVFFSPCLKLYASREVAAAREEGLHFVEGDIWFFAADGSSLEPKFSKEPRINSERGTYFAGVYSLTAGAGEPLQRVLAERIEANGSPHMKIIVWTPTTETVAQEWGWPDIRSMNEAAERALQLLPGDLRKRVVFKPHG